jgi:hypothetical protein
MRRFFLAAAVFGAVLFSAQGANELILSLNFQYTKNGGGFNTHYGPQINVTNSAVSSFIMAIPTNPVALPMGTVTNGLVCSVCSNGVTAGGYVLLYNTDTNAWASITVGGLTNSQPIQLLAGEFSLYRMSGTNLWAQSATNSPVLQGFILSY